MPSHHLYKIPKPLHIGRLLNSFQVFNVKRQISQTIGVKAPKLCFPQTLPMRGPTKALTKTNPPLPLLIPL